MAASRAASDREAVLWEMTSHSTDYNDHPLNNGDSQFLFPLNPFDVLGVWIAKGQKCLGLNQPGARGGPFCNYPVGKDRRSDAEDILSQMSARSPEQVLAGNMLEKLARILLCEQWHRNVGKHCNVQRVVDQWRQRITQFIAARRRALEAGGLVTRTTAQNHLVPWQHSDQNPGAFIHATPMTSISRKLPLATSNNDIEPVPEIESENAQPARQQRGVGHTTFIEPDTATRVSVKTDSSAARSAKFGKHADVNARVKAVPRRCRPHVCIPEAKIAPTDAFCRGFNDPQKATPSSSVVDSDNAHPEQTRRIEISGRVKDKVDRQVSPGKNGHVPVIADSDGVTRNHVNDDVATSPSPRAAAPRSRTLPESSQSHGTRRSAEIKVTTSVHIDQFHAFCTGILMFFMLINIAYYLF
ncbi:uncharacterized protein HMPREF1541_08830 [Cyphellophora europaea CBS 101466]|uniref:Uncharacterized protein n=1 Tax=Cyphellophora europaea (strain CBS 101466) TaxID=1220924 RepID=W2RJ81_CYPE1|nr:uncharacterized protein HMPREF1541_08830 [Cyphellophora europaea CBS 101466]ETN36552.1 hypothetical protein HMPREF1541_08830 [Cyphellophora europaea CBS 101466]